MGHEHLAVPWLVLLAKATGGDALPKSSTKPEIMTIYIITTCLRRFPVTYIIKGYLALTTCSG